MLRGLVNSLSVGLLLLLIVGSLVGLVLLGVWLVRRLVPSTREGFDAEVSSQILGVVATIFGLLLAFVVVLTFQSYGDAGTNARQEADSLAQIVRDTRVLPPADREPIDSAVGAYVRAVVNDEWPQLRDGADSQLAWNAADRIYRAMQAAKPATPSETAFYDDAVGRLNDALAARRSRIANAAGGLSAPIVGLVLLGTFVLLGYATFVGSRSAAFHAAGAGVIAVVVGFSLVVLLTYNYPFSGSLSIDPTPFQSGVLAQYFPAHT
jgi:hypothetical protein